MSTDSSRVAKLLDEYEAGPQALRAAVAGMTREQLLAKPIPGKWSSHEVVCHLADCEILYADRMHRVIAEERPTFMNMDPEVHNAKLAIPERALADDLALVEAVRKHMAGILRTLSTADFARVGIHSQDGQLSLETLLARITGHIPHHAKFIAEKRKALA